MLITIPPELDGRRLEQAVAALVPGLSRAEARELIGRGGVRAEGRGGAMKKGDRVADGATYRIDASVLDDRSPEERQRLAAKRADLVLLGEGERWAAVRKPAGLPSTARHFGDRRHFAAYARELLVERRPEFRTEVRDEGLVHRLDTGTSGACLIARDAEALADFERQRERGELYRVYVTIVAGTPAQSGEVDYPIAHHPRDASRMLCVRGGRRHRGKPQSARTRWELLESAGGVSLLRVRIDGGRRHQIRVHLAEIGHPVLGDPLYGEGAGAERLALHARELHFQDGGPKRFLADPGRHFWAFGPGLSARA